MGIPTHPALVKTISSQVKGQLPDYVRNDHPRFVELMKKYYEWTEQVGNPNEFIHSISAYSDVDSTIDSFVKFFKDQYAIDIPNSALVDKNWLVKNIKGFYRARGSEESIKFLFRILFNDAAGFRYPGDEILRASDGRWQQNSFIKTGWTAAVQSMEGRKITGSTSGAVAILEEILNTSEGGGNLARILVSSADGVFTNGETVTGNDANGNLVSFDLEIMLSRITVTNSGNNYSIGDNVIFNPSTINSEFLGAEVLSLNKGFVSSVAIDGGGTGFIVGEYLTLNNGTSLGTFGRTARIRVTAESGGVITGLEIENPGFNYTSLPTLTGTGSISGTGASFTITGTDIGSIKEILITQPGVGVTVAPNIDLSLSGDGTATGVPVLSSVITEQEGTFLTTDSLLNTDKVLQDNFFFQDYSYVIKSATVSNLWQETYLKILHPAGTKMFPQFSTDFEISVPFVQFMMEVQQGFQFILEVLPEINISLDASAVLAEMFLNWTVSKDFYTAHSWDALEEMAFASPGYSVNEWGTATPTGFTFEDFPEFTIDFFVANRKTRLRRGPSALVIEALTIEDFEDAPGSAAPNSAFWTTAEGAISVTQAKIGTKSWEFTGTQKLQNAGVITNNDKRKMSFWFYSDSIGSDTSSDKTRIAALYESVGSQGAAVYITNSGGSRFLGAAGGITTSANDLSIAQDTWYFIEFKVENETFELKVDNTVISSGAATGATLMDRFEIGHTTDQSAEFTSYVDAIRCYDRF